MKIKEGGGMDVQKEIDPFLQIEEIKQIFSDHDIHWQETEYSQGWYFEPTVPDYEKGYFLGAWEAWQAKAQAVPEWVNYELEKPKDGQKCLVVFESMDGDDSHRWMCIDEFNEGMFDFIANWEDECASVALPAGSVISKVRAVCWAETNLSNAPLSFDQFYKAQEPAND